MSFTLTHISPLLTLPPEILLTIISHLPTTSSLYTLSTTSHTLSSFIHTHASTICNTRIQSNQLLFRTSLILKSTHINGWLVPQHHSIFQAEEQWQHELESRHVSGTMSQCLQMGLGGCCFRSASVGSNSTAPRANRIIQTFSPQHRLRSTPDTYSPQEFIHNRPVSHSKSGTTHSTPPLSSPSTFNLSAPGPHYLTFLERYASEIVARWEMDIGRSARPETPVIIKHGAFATQLGPIVEMEDEEEMEQMEIQFASMLRLYCMRNWMLLCHNTFRNDISHESALSDDILLPSRGRLLVGRIKDKFGSALEKGKGSLRSVRMVFERKKASPPAKRLLFGEIDTDSASSLASAGVLSNKGSSSSNVEKDCWVKGLLWYYGVAGQRDSHRGASSSSADTAVASVAMSDEKVSNPVSERSRDDANLI